MSKNKIMQYIGNLRYVSKNLKNSDFSLNMATVSDKISKFARY